MPNLRKKIWVNAPVKRTPLDAIEFQFIEDHLIDDLQYEQISKNKDAIRRLVDADPGHIIVNEDGTYMPTRKKMKFLNSIVTDKISDNTTEIELRGEQGKPGNTPYIGKNGNWWIGDVDTEKPSIGGSNGLSYDEGNIQLKNGDALIGNPVNIGVDLFEKRGQSITADVKAGVPALAIHGKTYQNITKKNSNLIVLEDASYTTTGGVNVSVSKGVISLSGTATAGAEIKLCEVYLSPGTYYFKRNHDNVNLDVYYTDGVTQSSVDGSFVVEKEKRIAIYVYHNGSFVAPGTAKPMLNVGDLSLPWVAGIHNSPSPDFPAEIHGAGESLNLILLNNSSETFNGITVTSSADGLVNVSGNSLVTSTAHSFVLKIFSLAKGTYYFNAHNEIENFSLLINENVSNKQLVENKGAFSLDSDKDVRLYVYHNGWNPSSSEPLKPMLVHGNLDKSWQPFGHKVAVKRTCGSSQLDVTYPLTSPLYEGDKIQPDGKIIRKKKKMTLTGKENFVLNDSSFPYMAYLLNCPQSKNTHCSHFEVLPNATKSKCGINTDNTFNVWYFNYMGVADDLTAFKEWLAVQYAAGTPLMILYESSNSTTEYVTPSSQLELVDGVNTVQDVGFYPATLNLYYSKCGMPIFNSVKPQEGVKVDTKKLDYHTVMNAEELTHTLNISDTLEEYVCYKFLVNVRVQGLLLEGGVWFVEGCKCGLKYEWQLARLYYSTGLKEKRRSKMAGVWNAFV